MRTLLLGVAYDGAAFHGWQRQPQLRTVQGTLEEALSEALAEPIALAGAGRTDGRVHARGQGASFKTRSPLPVHAFAPMLNRRLPPDVRVMSAEERANGFHARHSALGRRYGYRLLDRDDVLLCRFAWRPRRAVVPEALERATRVLEGRHDCSSFESSGSTSVNPVCRVDRARWARWEGGLRFDFVADHFLYRMVRNVVGTALGLMASTDPAGRMAEILAARDRSRAGNTAPPHALCLEQVFYAAEGDPS